MASGYILLASLDSWFRILKMCSQLVNLVFTQEIKNREFSCLLTFWQLTTERIYHWWSCWFDSVWYLILHTRACISILSKVDTLQNTEQSAESLSPWNATSLTGYYSSDISEVISILIWHLNSLYFTAINLWIVYHKNVKN